MGNTRAGSNPALGTIKSKEGSPEMVVPFSFMGIKSRPVRAGTCRSTISRPSEIGRALARGEALRFCVAPQNRINPALGTIKSKEGSPEMAVPLSFLGSNP